MVAPGGKAERKLVIDFNILIVNDYNSFVKRQFLWTKLVKSFTIYL